MSEDERATEARTRTVRVRESSPGTLAHGAGVVRARGRRGTAAGLRPKGPRMTR